MIYVWNCQVMRVQGKYISMFLAKDKPVRLSQKFAAFYHIFLRNGGVLLN